MNYRIIISSGVNYYSNEIPLLPAACFCPKFYQNCPCAQASPPCNTTAVYHDNAMFLPPSTGVVAGGLLIPATQGFVLVVLFLGGKGRAMLFFSSFWLMTLWYLSPGKNMKAQCKPALWLRPASFSTKFWYWCLSVSFSRWTSFLTPLFGLKP